jgi:hypothetical protein
MTVNMVVKNNMMLFSHNPETSIVKKSKKHCTCGLCENNSDAFTVLVKRSNLILWMQTFSKKEGATSKFRAPDGFRLKEVPCCRSTDTRRHSKIFSSVDDLGPVIRAPFSYFVTS